jgi:hypothetical protein
MRLGKIRSREAANRPDRAISPDQDLQGIEVMCRVHGLTTVAMVLLVAAGCASTNEPQSEDESPIDRIFDPLDNVVDEVNRELNEGDDEKRDER